MHAAVSAATTPAATARRARSPCLASPPTYLPPARAPAFPARPSSFRHVLGVEADSQLVLAAKELKEKGRLEYVSVGDEGGEVRRGACAA
jgi:hypothetical protein